MGKGRIRRRSHLLQQKIKIFRSSGGAGENPGFRVKFELRGDKRIDLEIILSKVNTGFDLPPDGEGPGGIVCRAERIVRLDFINGKRDGESGKEDCQGVAEQLGEHEAGVAGSA